MVDPAWLTGREEGQLVELPGGHRLLAPVADAFQQLKSRARDAGFDLAVASSYRSFDRQLAIFNGKARGQRPVHDDAGGPVDLDSLDARGRLAAILRYSALPGASRHHWGTDLDVYDAGSVPADYCVQLTPDEVAAGGVFDGLHTWLDAQMASATSEGFYRPYAVDRGGVAVERWHLSYAPLAMACEQALTVEMLLDAWQDRDLALRADIEARLDEIMARYITVPKDWCAP
ncbi:MAG: M15 family metallopeptidase [Pseudomonadota bacterium]